MTSISSLSFPKLLLETLALLSLSPPPPTSSNLRQFGDNYSLLEEMWLAVSAASWVGKIALKTQGDFHFSFSLWEAGLCGWLWSPNNTAAALQSHFITLTSCQKVICQGEGSPFSRFFSLSSFSLVTTFIHTEWKNAHFCSARTVVLVSMNGSERMCVCVCLCVPSWYQVKDCCTPTCVQRGSRWSDPVTLMAAV